ncbi:MAG: AAA family ATPase [Alphaproteobacteria bacterium]|nr:AAA family ATPase [Alphaproteobacteria bacterium]
MRVRRLRIENFRKFRKAIELAGFGDGLNLVCEPNEVGKSTVLEAMRAVLFERYSAKGEKVKQFRPYGDEVAPVIELEFEVDGEQWFVQKRFLEKPSVALSNGKNQFQSDEAEDRLQSLLGFARAGNRGADDESRGALGLLWVEQGHSFALDAPGQLARRTFEAVLEGEVGAITGGKRTAAVTKSIDTSFAEYYTPTGRSARRLAEAETSLLEAERLLVSTQAEFVEFDQLLTTLESKRGELRRVARELNDAERLTAITQIKGDIERAKIAAQELSQADVALRHAEADHKRALASVVQRRTDRQLLANALNELSEREQAVVDNQLSLKELRDAEAAAAADLLAARTAVSQSEVVLSRAKRALKSAQKAAVFLAAFERLDRAQLLSSELEVTEEVIAAEKMDSESLAKLDAFDRKVVQARAALAAGSATLEIKLQSDARAIKLDGEALDADHKSLVDRARTIDVGEIGSVVITPASSGVAAAARLRAAEQDLESFLSSVGHTTVEGARAAARLRQENVQQSTTLAARILAQCPADPALTIGAGLSELRTSLSSVDRSALEESIIGDLDAAYSAAERHFQDARQSEGLAVASRDAALSKLQAAELSDAKLQAAFQQAKADADRLRSQLSQSEGKQSDEVLEAQLAAAKVEEARALLAKDAARQASDALDLSALQRRLEAAERRAHQLAEDRLGLSTTIARLEEQAKTLGGAGPAAKLDAAKDEVEACKANLERVRHEASAIELLRRVLNETRAEASKRFLEPVARRVEPYLQRVLPNAALTFADDFKPSELTRLGRQEAAEHLSKGTQEQVAILTRLAFADLLIAKGKPASLILDDALVFSDDDRFETMTDILSEAASRMQVIILSCRSSAYRHVQATRININR